MCCRYFLIRDGQDPIMENMLENLNRRDLTYKTGEVFPGDSSAILANNRQMIPTPFVMQWGYHLSGGKLLFNTRSETASTKPIFSDGMKQRRCLIPMNYYFEWVKEDDRKIRYTLQPVRHECSFLAGIYRSEPSGPVFSVLTREPVPEIRHIHDRMPVIFSPDIALDWLNLHYDPNDLLNHALSDFSFHRA